MTGTNGSGPFHAGDSHCELLRAVSLCHPGWACLPRATFAPDSASSPSWLRWKEEVFVPLLLPAMEEAQCACAAGDCRGLAACDRAIDSGLSPELRKASRDAGTALMGAYYPPRSEKLWSRYGALLASGEVPGHLAILCALRGATFHLPPLSTVSAYIFLEAKGGAPRDGVSLWMNMVGDCLMGRRSPKNTNLRAA